METAISPTACQSLIAAADTFGHREPATSPSTAQSLCLCARCLSARTGAVANPGVVNRAGRPSGVVSVSILTEATLHRFAHFGAVRK
jgi:hypothetical protein